jgi:hypothetical protein
VKRVLAIALALVLLVTLAVPVMADSSKDADTTANVGGTGGSPPIIKCKWETSSTVADEESGDPSHLVPGVQIDPIIDEAAQTCMAEVFYWVVVTDPQGVGNIGEVAVDVFEPDVDPNYKWKYKVVLTSLWDPTLDKQAMKDALTAADAAGLVTYAPGYDLDEICGFEGEIDQGKVKIYRGSAIIEGHQPGGIYWVRAFAFDLQQDMSAILENCFVYVRTEALVKDFSLVDWGDVVVCSEAVFCGDSDMTTPLLPTIKSTGNCALDISIHYSEMFREGDGRLMDEVEFDAFLVSDVYRVGGILPCVDTDISHPTAGHVYAPICTPTKIGFSIHVFQAQPGIYWGTVTLTGTDNALPWGGANCSNPACARGHGP